MDSIYINRLVVETHIGVTAQERAAPQKLHVSVELYCDTTKAGRSDALEDTIDYEAVCNTIKALTTTERKTVEKLAADIADTLLIEFKPKQVKVTVWKYILKDTDGVAITIHRSLTS